MRFSEKLVKIRNERGMTQQEFADFLGVSQAAITYWENGKRQPKLPQLQNMAHKLEMTVAELMDDPYIDALYNYSNMDLWALLRKSVSISVSRHLSQEEKTKQLQQILISSSETIKGGIDTYLGMFESDEEADAREILDYLVECLPKLNHEGRQQILDQIKMVAEVPRFKKDE